eukprot:Hpha_TRINITY_DN16773_c1_g1::TRINITY_DN16773_c1_g1_i1::g.78262::m.78262
MGCGASSSPPPVTPSSTSSSVVSSSAVFTHSVLSTSSGPPVLPTRFKVRFPLESGVDGVYEFDPEEEGLTMGSTVAEFRMALCNRLKDIYMNVDLFLDPSTTVTGGVGGIGPSLFDTEPLRKFGFPETETFNVEPLWFTAWKAIPLELKYGPRRTFEFDVRPHMHQPMILESSRSPAAQDYRKARRASVSSGDSPKKYKAFDGLDWGGKPVWTVEEMLP